MIVKALLAVGLYVATQHQNNWQPRYSDIHKVF